MQALENLWHELQNLTVVGGPVLVALTLLAFFIAYALLILWHCIQHPTTEVLSSREWLTMLQKPDRCATLVDRLDRALGPDPAFRARQLQTISQSLFGDPDRRFSFAFVMIGVAPLVGLLGTVAGLYTTFQGMGTTAATNETPIDMMSRGISEALISTEAGLVIGVPTLVICSWMKGRHEQRKLAFEKVESKLLQLSRTPI